MPTQFFETPISHYKRKKRSDAGKHFGHRPPRSASSISHLTNGTSLIALTGKYGTGKHLRVSTLDLPDLMNFSDNGKALYVVPSSPDGNVTVRIKGPKIQEWKHSTNHDDAVTVNRFLTAETNRGRRITTKDHNPFNLIRSNLEVEVPKIKQSFPIDWEKAMAARQTNIARCTKCN